MNTTMSWLLRSDDGGSHTKRWGEYFISEGNVLLLLTEARSGGCVAKIFKLIKNEYVIAAKTYSSRENGYTFYPFYLCSIVEYLTF